MPAPSRVVVHAPPRDEVAPLLQQAGYDAASLGLRDLEAPHAPPPQLFLVDGSHESDAGLRLCHKLRLQHQDPFVPILFLAADALNRLAGLECGADAILVRPFQPAELLAQVQALVRIKDRQDLLASKASDAQRVNKRLQAAQQQMDMEMELAKRLQENFLPQTLPQLPKVRFAVQYKPCARVGGDFYDVFRLDEKHLGFYVADAMGHGVPASLLTIFVKQGVRAKEIIGSSYRLTPTNEVLQKLNHDLIAQQLSDLPFITMVYVLFNFAEGTLHFSRAGHPYPIYVPKDGPAELWQIEGSLLGVFETQYRIRTQSMKPGDKLLLYTDGMDAASFGTQAPGQPSLLAAVEAFRSLPIDEFVGRLSSDLFMQSRQNDDLTVLGMELLP